MGGLLGRGCWRGLCWAGGKVFQEAAGEEVLGGREMGAVGIGIRGIFVGGIGIWIRRLLENLFRGWMVRRWRRARVADLTGGIGLDERGLGMEWSGYIDGREDELMRWRDTYWKVWYEADGAIELVIRKCGMFDLVGDPIMGCLAGMKRTRRERRHEKEG
jgi:hypothetical protein